MDYKVEIIYSMIKMNRGKARMIHQRGQRMTPIDCRLELDQLHGKKMGSECLDLDEVR